MASFHYVGKTKPENYMYVYTSVCSEQFFSSDMQPSKFCQGIQGTVEESKGESRSVINESCQEGREKESC